MQNFATVVKSQTQTATDATMQQSLMHTYQFWVKITTTQMTKTPTLPTSIELVHKKRAKPISEIPQNTTTTIRTHSKLSLTETPMCNFLEKTQHRSSTTTIQSKQIPDQTTPTSIIRTLTPTEKAQERIARKE